VRRVVREAYAQWIPVIGREPMPMKADYERAVRDHEIDLLYADDDLVGLIEVVANSDHLFIENIAVVPRRQGQGLGRRLLRHTEDRARKTNLGELRLLTNQAFQANIRLYESVGFRIDRTEPFSGGMRLMDPRSVLTKGAALAPAYARAGGRLALDGDDRNPALDAAKGGHPSLDW